MNPKSFKRALAMAECVEVEREQTVITGRVFDFVIGDRLSDYHGGALASSSVAFTVESIVMDDGTRYQPSPQEADEGKYSWTFDEATIHLPTLVRLGEEKAEEFVNDHINIPAGYTLSLESRGMRRTSYPSPHILYTGTGDDGRKALRVIAQICDSIKAFRQRRGEVE